MKWDDMPMPKRMAWCCAAGEAIAFEGGGKANPSLKGFARKARWIEFDEAASTYVRDIADGSGTQMQYLWPDAECPWDQWVAVMTGRALFPDTPERDTSNCVAFLFERGEALGERWVRVSVMDYIDDQAMAVVLPFTWIVNLDKPGISQGPFAVTVRAVLNESLTKQGFDAWEHEDDADTMWLAGKKSTESEEWARLSRHCSIGEPVYCPVPEGGARSKYFASILHENTGVARIVMALLTVVNKTLTYVPSAKSRRPSMHKGRRTAMPPEGKIVIDLIKRHQSVRLYDEWMRNRAEERAKRARHAVRGHWVVWKHGSRTCGHQWTRYTKVEDDGIVRQECPCGARRTWRAQFERGDASLGYVNTKHGEAHA